MGIARSESADPSSRRRVRICAIHFSYQFTQCQNPTRFGPDSATHATAQYHHPQTPRFSDSLILRASVEAEPSYRERLGRSRSFKFVVNAFMHTIHTIHTYGILLREPQKVPGQVREPLQPYRLRVSTFQIRLHRTWMDTYIHTYHTYIPYIHTIHMRLWCMRWDGFMHMVAIYVGWLYAHGGYIYEMALCILTYLLTKWEVCMVSM